MRRLGRAFVLAAVLLAGCANPLLRPDEAHEVAGMLAHYRSVAVAPADEQRRDIAAAQATYEKTANDATRLTLALALLLPHAPARDDARVQALLGAVAPATGGSPSARHDLAQTLLALVVERQREQRKSDQLAHQLREERRKADDMQQKIESLRAIDRDMRSRRSGR
jgi:hypothetical protein